MMDPSDPDFNRALFNKYYEMCCGKGGVAVQQCGWIRSFHLCTGGIDDSHYLEVTKILERQKQFFDSDTSSAEAGTNVFDKGYRLLLAALQAGQKCLQPNFAQSDRKFTALETLNSACVAVIRSGNERAVERMKNSWFIKRGTTLAIWDLDLLDDIWLAWSFKVNFMYEPVR